MFGIQYKNIFGKTEPWAAVMAVFVLLWLMGIISLVVRGYGRAHGWW